MGAGYTGPPQTLAPGEVLAARFVVGAGRRTAFDSTLTQPGCRYNSCGTSLCSVLLTVSLKQGCDTKLPFVSHFTPRQRTKLPARRAGSQRSKAAGPPERSVYDDEDDEDEPGPESAGLHCASRVRSTSRRPAKCT